MELKNLLRIIVMQHNNHYYILVFTFHQINLFRILYRALFVRFNARVGEHIITQWIGIKILYYNLLQYPIICTQSMDLNSSTARIA